MKTPEYTRNAVRKYQQKLISVVIRLNPENEDDKRIIDFIQKCENKTSFIKKLITDQMDSTNERT